jgi:ASC-1-like (ASCH) protein
MKTWFLKFASKEQPDDIFDLIISGKKTVETRSRNPNDGENDYTNIKEGDILHIKSLDSGREVYKTVVFNHVYDSVDEMVKNEDVENIFPGVGSKENMLKNYEEVKSKWGQKYKHELENYGIVAIGFK